MHAYLPIAILFRTRSSASIESQCKRARPPSSNHSGELALRRPPSAPARGYPAGILAIFLARYARGTAHHDQGTPLPAAPLRTVLVRLSDPRTQGKANSLFTGGPPPIFLPSTHVEKFISGIYTGRA
jgi:hypothetical protein